MCSNNLGILYSMQDRHDESLKSLAEAESIVPQLKGASIPGEIR
jgi:hypothetical protein